MLEAIKNNFIKLFPTNTVKEALNLLTENRINGAPVVDENGKLIGIIVKADLFRFLMDKGHYDTCPVEWVMTKKVITAKDDEDIIDIAKRLRSNNIIAIPVIDENKFVTGMVTLENILDSFMNLVEKNKFL